MDRKALRRAAHETEVTVWVGKAGVDSAADELGSQLEEREFVKVRFLRSAMAGDSVEDLTTELVDRVGAAGVEVRGHTAVFAR